MLKSSGRSKENIHEMSEELAKKLKYPTKSTVIGFTIAIRRVEKSNK